MIGVVVNRPSAMRDEGLATAWAFSVTAGPWILSFSKPPGLANNRPWGLSFLPKFPAANNELGGATSASDSVVLNSASVCVNGTGCFGMMPKVCKTKSLLAVCLGLGGVIGAPNRGCAEGATPIRVS